MSPPVIPTLKPKFFFGLTTQVNGNCIFLNENEIIYPASGVLVIYDTVNHRQKYIHLAEPQKIITAMALCINKYDFYIMHFLRNAPNFTPIKNSIGIFL